MTIAQQDLMVSASRERLRMIERAAARGANEPDRAEVFVALEEIEAICGQRPTDERKATRGLMPIGQVIQNNAGMLLRRGLRMQRKWRVRE